MESDYTGALQEVFDIQQAIQDIHPFLRRVFPVAVVEEGQFLIYDTDPAGSRYVFIKRAAIPMPVPAGVRAAFPLESYDNRAACVVTGEIFNSLDGYVTIFHEFVHCYQYETGEEQIKQTLGIARKARSDNDFMWELNYPFPYTDPAFASAYRAFLEALDTGDFSGVLARRSDLKGILSKGDHEYLVWQEWKEGFARFIENRICQRLGLPENHNGREQPYNRVVFYEGGANYIAALEAREHGLTTGITRLFARIRDG